MTLCTLYSLAVSLIFAGGHAPVLAEPTLMQQGSYRQMPGWLGPDKEEGVPDGQSPGFIMGRDPSVFHGGHASGTIKATTDDKKGWQSLTQGIRADSFRGKRIRLRGFVKTKAVSTYAGLWMRVDTIDHQAEFDNMSNRIIMGTTDWKAYTVVLDVPIDAVAIFFGGVMMGTGQSWFDDLSIETVDPSRVPSTGIWMGPDYSKDPTTPQNLDFLAAPKSPSNADIPGWQTGGPWSDDTHLDQQVRRDGKPTATLRSAKQKNVDLYLIQEVQAFAYRGKRVQFKAYVQTTGKIAGGVMLAVPGGGQWAVADVPQFVEKGTHWVKDTRDWKPVSAVLDIPNWARCIQFGFQLSSPGQLWASETSFKVVDPKTTPVTFCPAPSKIYKSSDLKKLPMAPVNMNFEK